MADDFSLAAHRHGQDSLAAMTVQVGPQDRAIIFFAQLLENRALDGRPVLAGVLDALCCLPQPSAREHQPGNTQEQENDKSPGSRR